MARIAGVGFFLGGLYRIFNLGSAASAGDPWAPGAQGRLSAWTWCPRPGSIRKPWRPWVVWLGGLHGCIDDCGRGKLTLSNPFLNFLEDVGDVEGQMVRRCRHHRDLCPALRELSLEDGQGQFRSDFRLAREDIDHWRFEAGAHCDSRPGSQGTARWLQRLEVHPTAMLAFPRHDGAAGPAQ